MSEEVNTDGIWSNDDSAETGHVLAILPAIDHKPPKPWDKQWYETALSYRRFVRFYLSQEPPRSVLEAYRAYRLATGGNEVEISAIRRVPGAWAKWAYARDNKGERIDGALTWARRGRAFDVDQGTKEMREQQNLWAERRQQLREIEWDAGIALLERGKRMLAGLLFRRMHEESISKDGKTIVQQTIYEPTDWGEREVMAIFKLASDLLRRGAGEPPNNVLIRDDWEAQARQADLDPEKLRDAVHRALLEQEMEEDDIEDE